ncbi:MAG: hypothetical protein AB7O97_01405 [Planctomycetota bacterium]
MRALLVLVFTVLGGCALEVMGSIPARVSVGELPGGARDTLSAARRAAESGRMRAALDLLGRLREAGGGRRQERGATDLDVEVERLRQDILRQRGRIGMLRAEADARIAAQAGSGPGEAAAHYLRGRLEPAGSPRQLAEFGRAAELDPTSMWPWLGYAYALRPGDPAQSLQVYERLYAASDRHPVVAVAYASSLRAAGRLRDAEAVYTAMLEDPEHAGAGHLGRAQVLLALGGPEERRRGWDELLLALRDRPFDPGAHAVLGELLRLGMADEQVEQCVDVLREDPARWDSFQRGRGAELLATLLQRLLQPHAALRAVATEISAGDPGDPVDAEAPPERDSQTRRRLRRWLHLATGDVPGFVAALRDELPTALLDDETNQVRGRWRTLFDGPWAGVDPMGSAELATGFCAALRDVGLLREAEMAAEVALQRAGAAGSARDALLALLDEVRAEYAFENALRGMLYRGYADAGGADLDAVLAEAARLSQRLFGRDVTQPDVRFTVPLVGEMLDPFAAGLCRHLARYNKHLALGRRAGGVAEGLLMTMLSLRDLPDDVALPVPGRCREVVGIDRSVRSLSGVLGGDLAGVALLNHYIVDYDAVVDWAAAIARRRAIAAEDGDAVLRDPMPADVAPFDPLDVSWRLAAVSSAQDSDLRAAVLEVIRLHERRHLVDSFHYLPFESNVWRGLGLLLRFGLSPSAIEAEMERRAELAALAQTDHPAVVLAHVAEFLIEDDPESPHVRGFGQLARDLVEALVAEGVPAADAAVAQWHRLDADAVRRAARRLLGDLP